MGQLQITTAEIITRILRVCHVKKKRIYTVSHVKNPYLTCVSCALYLSMYVLVTIHDNNRAASDIVVSGRVMDRQERMYDLAIYRFMCRRCRVADLPVVAK